MSGGNIFSGLGKQIHVTDCMSRGVKDETDARTQGEWVNGPGLEG